MYTTRTGPNRQRFVPGNRSRRTERRYGRNRNGFTGKRLFCFPQSGPNSADGETGGSRLQHRPLAAATWGHGRIQHTVGGFYRLGDKQALSAGVRLLTLPSSDLTDDYGNLLRTTHPYDLSVNVGYSRTVARNLAVGATVGYIRSSLGENLSANGVAFDAGAYYRHAIRGLGGESNWALGLTLDNMGTALDYGGGSAPLPWKLQLGAAATLEFSPRHRLEATAEGGYRFRPSGNRSLSGGVGAGYTFARLATVRAGYHFGDQEKGDPRYTSFGCGIHFYHFHLDAAYWLSGTDSPVRNTWMLSLRIDLGRRSRP